MKCVYCIEMDGNDLLTYCVAGSCLSRFGRVGVLSWQTSNSAPSISGTKREAGYSMCVYVCVTGGWFDIHVALIIVPLLLGFHSGLSQALMWVWSHVTLGCWAEVGYWCRHLIVTHISYHRRLFEMKAAVCMCVCPAVWMGTECQRGCLGSSLVSWKFRGNERDVLGCKYANTSMRSKSCWIFWKDDMKREERQENRQQFHIEIVQQKKRWSWLDGWVDILSSTLHDLASVLNFTNECSAVKFCYFCPYDSCSTFVFWVFLFCRISKEKHQNIRKPYILAYTISSCIQTQKKKYVIHQEK